MDLQGFTPSQRGGEHGPEETERGEASWNEQHRISMSCLWDLRCWSQRGICVTRPEVKVQVPVCSGACGGGSLFSLSLSAVGLGVLLPSIYSRDLTHNPKSPGDAPSALYYWKICSRAFFPQGSSLQTPSPLCW